MKGEKRVCIYKSIVQSMNMTKRESMFKNILKIVMIYFIPIILFSQIPILKKSTEKSTIILPVESNLTQLETYLNKTIPTVLNEVHDINRVCLKPQYIKTDAIPKCRRDGFKISCEKQSLTIKTIPEIRCDIEGWVKRDGNLSITGKGDTLTFAFPIKSRITAKSHIDGTATAAAILYIKAVPYIRKNWSIGIDVNVSYVWSKKPTITLLNGINISIQNSVEEKLKKRLDTLVKKIPQRLNRLDLKKRVQKIWDKVQHPIKIDKHTESYLVFKPDAILYSGFRIVDDILQTTLSIEGKTDIILGEKPSISHLIPLKDLQNIPYQKGAFKFHLPITLSYQELITRINTKYPNGYPIDLSENVLSGVLKLTNPDLKRNATGALSLMATLHYKSSNAFMGDIRGKIRIEGTPSIDVPTQTIVFKNLSYQSQTDSQAFDTLINLTDNTLLNPYLHKLMQISLKPTLQRGLDKANKALKSFAEKREKDTPLVLVATVKEASIERLESDETKLTLYSKMRGTLKATVRLKPE